MVGSEALFGHRIRKIWFSNPTVRFFFTGLSLTQQKKMKTLVRVRLNFQDPERDRESGRKGGGERGREREGQRDVEVGRSEEKGGGGERHKVKMMGREGVRVRRCENDSKRGRESERVRESARESKFNLTKIMHEMCGKKNK